MSYIERNLWFEANSSERQYISESKLLQCPESLVVLGEPGMGKSRLLGRLADLAGVSCYTARQLINCYDPHLLVKNASVVIVDALDEVVAGVEGYAVDLVLQKLGMLRYPRFIFSCRVGDWHAATSVKAIREQYGTEPLQVHLCHLERHAQISILTKKIGPEDAEKTLAHFDSIDLNFLGNPQTLELVARLDTQEILPDSSGSLLERATDILSVEHRDTGIPCELPRDDALDAAGAAFAALILTGSTEIVRHRTAELMDGQLPLSDVNNLGDGNVERVINTRLFSGREDSFSYCHRRIGEFLAAKWLAKRADTQTKRRRLLQLFCSHSRVPANLRGLHAWLVRDFKLAKKIIAADPMGVIEYGDADTLPPEQAKFLLQSLECLSKTNPNFWKWGYVRASSLFLPPLHDDITRILRDKNSTLGLRVLLVQQLADTERASAFLHALRDLFLDQSEDYVLRRLAGDALASWPREDWTCLVAALRCQESRVSQRLAFEMMQHVGIESFSDQDVVEVILAHAGLANSSFERETDSNSFAHFWGFAKCVPSERLESLLEILTHRLREMLPDYASVNLNNLIDLAHTLIRKRLETEPADPMRLWAWLEPYQKQHSYHRPAEKDIGAWILAHDETRRTIQRHILLDDLRRDVFENKMCLSNRSRSLIPDEGDIVALLACLDADDRSDVRWRDLLRLIPHDGEIGRTARDASKRFTVHDPKHREWLERLSCPVVPEWESEMIENERRITSERAAQFAEHRADYLEKIDKLRAGEYVIQPARAYLKLYDDIGQENPAHERVAEWLGTEVAEAAHQGFEAFLTRQPVRPNATRMAINFANDRRYISGDVVVAALAERLRTRTEPFADLPDERLMAGILELWRCHIDQHAGFPELSERLESELRERGVLDTAHYLYITPQFKKGRENIDLYRLRRSDADSELAACLAVNWLERFAEMPAGPEAKLIDCVLTSKLKFRLRDICEARLAGISSDQRRRNWDAVQILVDFDTAKRRFEGGVEPELLWHLRERARGLWSSDGPSNSVTPEQIEWIVSAFRGLWPAVDKPLGKLIMGDKSGWDASDFLVFLIQQLGKNTIENKAVDALTALRDAEEDGYTNYLRIVAAQQEEARVERLYAPPKLQEVSAILDGGPPANALDLQTVVLEALSEVQSRLRGDDVDSKRGFYKDDGSHKDEEPCRDELIKMLRVVEPDLEYMPEGHVADDKRIDIVVRANNRLMLPIEVKGQWHKCLWTAADKQLDEFYRKDWRAERGIYLVLWFGIDCVMTSPSGGDKPTTHQELQERLRDLSAAAQAGRVDIVVLDLTRQ